MTSWTPNGSIDPRVFECGIAVAGDRTHRGVNRTCAQPITLINSEYIVALIVTYIGLAAMPAPRASKEEEGLAGQELLRYLKARIGE